MRKYFYLGCVALVIILAVSLSLTLCSKRNLEKKWKDATLNVKAYSEQFSDYENKNRAFELTIEQLKYSKDSIFKEPDDVRNELKIKDSKLKSLQYVSSSFAKADTITLTDTVFKDTQVCMDTLLHDEWYSLEVKLEYPSTIVVEPKFISKKYIVVSAKRETVNPPSRFFLFRWFQRKHTIVNVDVVEKNPYVQNQSNRFVEIVR